MKISINWMMDHIQTAVSMLDVGAIVAKFNVHTAEIESYEKSDIDLQNLFLARVVSIDQAGLAVRCDELNQTITLPFRNDLQVGQLALIRRSDNVFTWEKLAKYHAEKEGLFPAVDCQQELLAGGWKDQCEDIDYIIDVDNKSINHRPDLWGHRGIAREVAAFMGWQLKPLETKLAKIKQVDYATASIATLHHTIRVEIADTAICPRLAALHCVDIVHKPSQIWMAMRLARVDSKPINSIVDITNYVMFDLSQPMHVFDAAQFADKTLAVRTAQSAESLELLDGQMITLSDQDIVITDGKHPVALAGVMGGKQASFSTAARSIIIESGSFKAAMVRNSAAQIKINSQACMRFAKQLDPMQNTIALQRFVLLAQQIGVVGKIDEIMVSVGKIIQPSTICVDHTLIETSLGVSFTSEQIVSLLEKLEFVVAIRKNAEGHIIYDVTVPTARITKDITIRQDIVEEIARLYGFANIAYVRPQRAMKSFDISSVMTLRKVKEYCAFTMNMHEVRDYLFYDESFLKRLGWYPADAIAIKNPVSENYKVLVTSLVPNLLKNVELNRANHELLNFFEHNSVWPSCASSFDKSSADKKAPADKALSDVSCESKMLSGILFGQKNCNFYDYKAQLQGLFAALSMPVVWTKPAETVEPWFDQLQVADIMLESVLIGRAGMLDQSFIRNIGKGQGFVFELQMDAILSYKPAEKRFEPWAKYQAVHVDISMLIDSCSSAATIEQQILQVDTKIDQVTLLDFFEKEEWAGKRSLTFRYRICDFEQNLTKEVIDQVTDKVVQKMTDQGAQIR